MIKNKIEDINQVIDESYKRIIDSGRMNLEDISILYQFGITTGLLTLSEILKVIDENDLKSAGKIYHSRFMRMIYLSMTSEYHYRTAHFYQTGQGLLLPIELQDAFLNLNMALSDLEIEMSFDLEKLDKSINQRELVYLFLALAEKNYIRSNTTLLAEAINLLTGYSEGSIERVIQNFNNTNGGLPENEKRNLLKKINDAIDSF